MLEERVKDHRADNTWMEQPAGRRGRALLIHLPAVQASRRHLTAQQVKEGGQRQAELCFHPQSSCKHQDLQRLLTSRHCQLSFGQRNGRPACQEGDTQGPEQLLEVQPLAAVQYQNQNGDYCKTRIQLRTLLSILIMQIHSGTTANRTRHVCRSEGHHSRA